MDEHTAMDVGVLKRFKVRVVNIEEAALFDQRFKILLDIFLKFIVVTYLLRRFDFLNFQGVSNEELTSPS